MKLIYICAPYSGDISNNVNRSRQYAERVIAENRDFVPVVPHLMFDGVYDDETERERVMEACVKVLSTCDELWVFGLKITSGMAEEIIYALENGIRQRQLVVENRANQEIKP